ncbi:hypothetical protein RJ640_026815 [Escallonia rubra]|uniref:Uncharacterized protein n=1 Tax=Escallonia rubra TaxID=112253 RepID=A0AA88TZX9_9ASTE|nr:hypothetical protein RJ640_026815 [Escallonia rubra]
MAELKTIASLLKGNRCLEVQMKMSWKLSGESMPFGNDPYKSAKILGYLNSQQTLAVFAVLIRSLKQNLSSKASHVVVFGGSYEGIGTTWSEKGKLYNRGDTTSTIVHMPQKP